MAVDGFAKANKGLDDLVWRGLSLKSPGVREGRSASTYKLNGQWCVCCYDLASVGWLALFVLENYDVVLEGKQSLAQE